MLSQSNDLSGLIQQARTMAAKDNTPYDIQYTTLNGVQIAFIVGGVPLKLLSMRELIYR